MIDGFRFPSLAEGRHSSELRLREKAGEIWDLQMQVRYRIDVNGVLIGHYVADFVYRVRDKEIVEDVKGKSTDLFKWKKKLMKAVHGIDVIEIPA